MRRRLMLALMMGLVLAMLILVCGCAEESDSVDEPPAAGQPARSGQLTDEDPGEGSAMRVTCIDVGKGDCLLVQAGDAAALVDTGYRGTADAVRSQMREQGIDHLDALILTHYDRDHVGGLRAIASTMDIATVYLPGYEGADKNYETTIAAVDDLALTAQRVTKVYELKLGPAQLAIHPSSVAYVSDAHGDEGNDNDASLVVTLTNSDDSYLFAGDLEEEGIETYLDGARGTFDVLKMPHHGEKSSNTDDLLDNVQPQIALITDASDDPADKKTLKLLKECGADIYRTSADGSIVVESDGTGSYQVMTDNGS